MPLFLDILILAVLVLYIALGAHRGFILTLCSLVAVLVALIGGNLIADMAAPKLAESIRPALEQSIQEALEEKAQEAGINTADVDVLAVLKDKGGLYEWAANAVDEALDSYDLIPDAAHIAANAAAAVAEQLAHGLLFLLGFFVVLIAWALLSHALDLVAKLPGLNSLNHTLGGAMGFLKGLVIVYLVSWALCSLTGFIPSETVEQTHILRFLTQHGPLDLLSAGEKLAF